MCSAQGSAHFIRRKHEKSGIVFHLGRTATEISGGKKVSGVVLSDGSRIAAQVVVAGVGVVPATGYLETSGLLIKGAVPVDARFQTAGPGHLRRGGHRLIPDPVTGEARRVEHWVEAERQGDMRPWAWPASKKITAKRRFSGRTRVTFP